MIRHIFALMPFENQMIILKISGQEIKNLFRHIGKSNGDKLAGGTFTYKNHEVTDAQIGHQQVKKEAFYYVVTSDYLASGGDHYTMFQNAVDEFKPSHKIRDLIINHIKQLTSKGQTINPKDDQRIIIQ
jgi:2',3'-cyclic-nucleotide 2'-phosphodiesterase (5'-nucleotidase family)